MSSEADELGLLTALLYQAFNFQSQKDQAHGLPGAIQWLRSMSSKIYRYENGVKVVTHIGGELQTYIALFDADLEKKYLDYYTATAEEMTQ